jgi:cytochrome c-type biogenesis protein CcmH/NrfF
VRHRTDPTALVAGLLFLAIGAVALVAGPGRFADWIEWVWPVAFLTLGVALLLRSGQHRSGNEVGAERGEDREVEQAGGGHHG